MRKLALIAAVVGAVLLGIQLRGSPATPSSNGPAVPAPTTTAPAPVPRTDTTAPTTLPAPPTSSAGPYGGTEAARKAWEPIVQGFALAYPDTAGLSKREWLANLRPYLAADVADALADIDLGKVPAGHYAGYQVLKVGDDALTVRVAYQEGWSLVLYIAATGPDRYRIARFDLATDYDD